MKRVSTKHILVFVMVLIFVSAAWAGVTKLGKPLTLKKQVAIDTLVKNRDQYIGKTLQVKGKVTETCDHAGCYMMLSDDKGNSVKIKRTDSNIVFPTSAMGKTATAEGKFVKIEMSYEDALEHAKSEAKERKIPFDESKAKIETVIWQLESTGAEIED